VFNDIVDGTGTAIISWTVDISTVWTYVVEYNYTDAAWNVSTTITRTVIIEDTTIPVITLNGSGSITLEVWSTYTELWAERTDNYDWTGSAIISGTVDGNTVWTYVVEYGYTDNNGNIAGTVTRTVIIEDTTEPVITITAPTKLNNGSITDTTITITDNYLVATGDISIWSWTVSASDLVCTQTSLTQVDCTISVDSTWDLVINASDVAWNTDTATEVTYIIDTVAPNAPSIVVDVNPPNGVNTPTVLSFSSLDNIAIDRYDLIYPADDWGAGTWIATTITDATGPISLVLDPDNSPQWVTVVAYDTAWNSSQTTIYFPPVVTIIAPTTISNTTITDSTVTIDTPSWGDLTSIQLLSGGTSAILWTCTWAWWDTTDPYANPVTCTILNIADSGTITVAAEDASNWAIWSNTQSYIIDTVDPVITITAPTKIDNSAITNTTIRVVDVVWINAADVSLWTWTTASTSWFSCVQTTAEQVDCIVTITDSWDIEVIASDLAGNTPSASENTYIIDTIPPVLSLVWSGVVTVEVATSYTDLWALFTDNVDGTWSVVWISSVDINTVWTYMITYDHTDAAWNTWTQITRTVNVVDTTPPVLTLNGSWTITLEVWTSYSELWTNWSDNYDGTGSAIVSGTVDVNTVWTYVVEYNYTDVNGNVWVRVTRTIIIEDTTEAVITLNWSGSITLEAWSTYSEYIINRSKNSNRRRYDSSRSYVEWNSNSNIRSMKHI